MHDRPNATELLLAARDYLEKELLPTLTDSRHRYQTRIAVNVMGIIERELAVQRKHWMEEGGELFFLLRGRQSYWAQYTEEMQQEIRQGNVMLCDAIRRGEFDAPERFRSLGEALWRMTVRKLEVANPAGAAQAGNPPLAFTQTRASLSGTYPALPPMKSDQSGSFPAMQPGKPAPGGSLPGLQLVKTTRSGSSGSLPAVKPGQSGSHQALPPVQPGQSGSYPAMPPSSNRPPSHPTVKPGE